MNRTYASTDISRVAGVQRTSPSPPHPLIPLPLHILTFSLLLSFLVSSCLPSRLLPSSTPPIVRVGLIAPFEGTYRRTGYELLASMRAAIAESPRGDIAVIPQALNDSGQSEQAVRVNQKLRVDPAVVAIIAPLSPWLGLTMEQLHGATEPSTLSSFWLFTWFSSDLVTPNGVPHDENFGEQEDLNMLSSMSSGQIPLNTPFHLPSLVAAVAKIATQQDAERIVIAGVGPLVEIDAALPLIPFDSISEMKENDALLWLGAPDKGAALLNQLRASYPEMPFWMGPLGGDPVFRDHAFTHHRVYWAIWSNSYYNQWADSHNPSSPLAYLVYRQTEWVLWHLSCGCLENVQFPVVLQEKSESRSQAPLRIVGPASSSDISELWEIVFFELDEAGQSRAYKP
ncbi:MAG: hypothetical protein AAF702_16205 [Chloroflexota bacterium]